MYSRVITERTRDMRHVVASCTFPGKIYPGFPITCHLHILLTYIVAIRNAFCIVTGAIPSTLLDS